MHIISSQNQERKIQVDTKEIKRTIQYWRIVNAKDSSPLSDDYDWCEIFDNIEHNPFSKQIMDREHVGKIVKLNNDFDSVINEKRIICGRSLAQQKNYGIILASNKDYIPYQQNGETGDQSPVVLNEGWDAVDNSFIWHLPFGNMFAILFESTSSSRPKRYASWLTQLLKEEGIFDDPECVLSAEPVIDQNAIRRIKNAKGLRSVVIRTGYGKDASSSPLAKMFSTEQTFDNIEIEMKVKVKRGKKYVADEVNILNWFQNSIGNNIADLSKATVNIVDASGENTEINLIKERLSRKKDIQINQNVTAGSIDKDLVFKKIAEAYIKDCDELYCHKDDGRS